MSWYCLKRIKEDVKREKEEANKVLRLKNKDPDQLQDCIKDIRVGGKGILQVFYDSSEKCSRAKDCTTLCEHNKK